MLVDGQTVAAVVGVGSWVRVRDDEGEDDWRIVASHEADPSRRFMSEDCPMAQALLGHRAGERVPVQGPGGRRPVTIVRVGL